MIDVAFGDRRDMFVVLLLLLLFHALLLVKEVSDLQRQLRVVWEMVSEVGASIGATKETGSFVVGSSSFFCGFKGSKPHSYLLCGVFDLCHPFS